jgi:hypothetical protein
MSVLSFYVVTVVVCVGGRGAFTSPPPPFLSSPLLFLSISCCVLRQFYSIHYCQVSQRPTTEIKVTIFSSFLSCSFIRFLFHMLMCSLVYLLAKMRATYSSASHTRNLHDASLVHSCSYILLQLFICGWLSIGIFKRGSLPSGRRRCVSLDACLVSYNMFWDFNCFLQRCSSSNVRCQLKEENT